MSCLSSSAKKIDGEGSVKLKKLESDTKRKEPILIRNTSMAETKVKTVTIYVNGTPEEVEKKEEITYDEV